MPTLREWKEFKEWREGGILSIKNSREYQEATQEIEDAIKKYKNNDYTITSIRCANIFRDALFDKIYPETIEGCMNWLLERHERD